MWQQSLDTNLVPEALRGITTSVWEFLEDQKRLALVGVMRPSLLSPPYLWLHAFGSSYGVLRKALEHVDWLQEKLNETKVFAEVDPAIPNNLKFLAHCGFKVHHELPDRIVMVREL